MAPCLSALLLDPLGASPPAPASWRLWPPCALFKHVVSLPVSSLVLFPPGNPAVSQGVDFLLVQKTGVDRASLEGPVLRPQRRPPLRGSRAEVSAAALGEPRAGAPSGSMVATHSEGAPRLHYLLFLPAAWCTRLRRSPCGCAVSLRRVEF